MSTFNNFKNSINEIVEYCSTKGVKQLIRFFIEMIVIVLIIAVFKFPFILVRDYGIEFVTSMAIELNATLLTIWNALWDLGYTLLGIYMFMKIVGKRYLNINNK